MNYSEMLDEIADEVETEIASKPLTDDERAKRQRVWDSMLIDAFYTRPDIKMAWINIQYFKHYNKYPSNEFPKLKRTTKEIWQRKMTVARFISACIPKLAKVLWDHPHSKKEAIINALQKSKADTQSSLEDARKRKEERTLFDKSAKDYRVSQQMYMIYKNSIANANQTMSAAGIRNKMKK